MSDYIPIEIQTLILGRLPVKSLIQFRSVSKTWKSVIDSPKFISGYGSRLTEPTRIVIEYRCPEEGDDDRLVFAKYAKKIVWMVDNDHFPIHQFPPPRSPLIHLITGTTLVGNSHGLICWHGYIQDTTRSNKVTGQMAVVWNPSIRKSIGIVIFPDVSKFPVFRTVVSFGVCPINLDPTLVKITSDCTNLKLAGNKPWEVQVFKLSSKGWKTLNGVSNNIPRGSIVATFSEVVIERFIYWLCFDRIVGKDDGRVERNTLIVSFDMTAEEFSVIDLPNCLSRQDRANLTISNLRDSVVVVEHSVVNEKQVCGVWMKMDDSSNSFKKLYTINTPYETAKILKFRKNGEPIMETSVRGKPSAIKAYKPSTEHYHDLEINGVGMTSSLSYYKETLILSDQPADAIYM